MWTSNRAHHGPGPRPPSPTPGPVLPVPRPPQRGSALLAVLWLSAALAAIAFSLANTVRGETERASTASEGVRAYYLASGAIDRAALEMLWGVMFPGPRRQYTPGAPALHFDFPTGAVDVEVIPETARLNLNAARPEELFRLLLALGVEPGRAREITLAIADWRAPNAEGGGQFDSYYLSLAPSFRAPHASFQETEELLLVKGMTPDIYYGTWEAVAQGDGQPPRLVPRGGLRDCVSVFGSVGSFDVNTAPPAVLAAIGLPADAVAGIVNRRRVAPYTPAELAQWATGGPAFQRLRIGGNSIFTLRATARLKLPNGGLSDLRRSVAAMVKFMPAGYDAPYHILRWYDTAWSN